MTRFKNTRENAKAIAAVLRATRERLGRRQLDVAEDIGCAEGQVNRWENGREIPRGSMLFDWANSLGFDLFLIPRQSS